MNEANEAETATAVSLCGGCGYPVLGCELCAFCEPVVAEQPAA